MPYLICIVIFILLFVFIKRGISYIIGLIVDGIEFIVYDVIVLFKAK